MNDHDSDQLKATSRSTLRRGRKRASYDRALVNSVIDEAMLAWLGMVVDGQPFVLPTAHWRDGDRVYWHGASSGRMAGAAAGQPVCLSLALLDGVVLARSAFHHSVNYRSVMLFGRPEAVTDPIEKGRQLELFIERLTPGRWPQLRPMHDKELKATGILSLPIDEGSAKLRSGPPEDDDEDYGWPVWAGVYPLRRGWGTPEPCPRLADGLPAPAAPPVSA